MISEDDDADVPPLQDMSRFLVNQHQVLNNNAATAGKTVDNGSKLEILDRKNAKPKAFGGLQKGFFDNKPRKPSQDHMPLIKPRNTKNPLIIDEVQKELMNQSEQSGKELYIYL